MPEYVEALLARAWKNEQADFTPGRHDIDQTLVVRVWGHVEQHADQTIAPTGSIPLVSVLAYFWEQAGIERDTALTMLREAIHQAMQNGQNRDAAVQQRMQDVQAAISAVKTGLIDALPKIPRRGRLDTSGLDIEVMAVAPGEAPLIVEAA